MTPRFLGLLLLLLGSASGQGDAGEVFIEGRLVDGLGEPKVGVPVRLLAATRVETARGVAPRLLHVVISARDGRFAFPHPRFCVEARSGGLDVAITALESFFLETDDAALWRLPLRPVSPGDLGDLVLEEAALLHGRLTGFPEPRSRSSLGLRHEGSGAWLEVPLRSGERLEIALRPGLYRAVLSVDGWDLAVRSSIGLNSGERHALESLFSPRALGRHTFRKHHLRILDAEGRPVAGALVVPGTGAEVPLGLEVIADLHGLPVRAVRTEADGSCLVRYPLQRAIRLGVHPREGPAFLASLPDTGEVLRLPPTREVFVTLEGELPPLPGRTAWLLAIHPRDQDTRDWAEAAWRRAPRTTSLGDPLPPPSVVARAGVPLDAGGRPVTSFQFVLPSTSGSLELRLAPSSDLPLEGGVRLGEIPGSRGDLAIGMKLGERHHRAIAAAVAAWKAREVTASGARRQAGSDARPLGSARSSPAREVATPSGGPSWVPSRDPPDAAAGRQPQAGSGPWPLALGAVGAFALCVLAFVLGRRVGARKS